MFPSDKIKPSVLLKVEDVVTCLTASVVFEKAEGNVGEPLQLQLAITSLAHESSKPIRLSGIKIVFEGCLRPVRLDNESATANASDTTATSRASVVQLLLREPRTSADPSSIHSPTNGLSPLVGATDLAIGPSQTKAINLTCIPREAGEARVASITMMMEEEKFDLIAAITNMARPQSFWWKQQGTIASRRRIGMDRDPAKCKIMPKPPKIRISTPNLKENYYTNERVVLEIFIRNDESESASVLVDMRLFGSPDAVTKVSWLDDSEGGDGRNKGEGDRSQGETDDSVEQAYSNTLSRHVGIIDRFSEAKLAVVLTDTKSASDYELEIVASYHLVSDMETPIVKTANVDISFIRPFEANYELLARLHPQEWPDFFHADDAEPQGLWQRWCLNATVVSFALEPLIIEDMSLLLLELKGAAVCHVDRDSQEENTQQRELLPREARQARFIVDIQKPTLGDRRPTALDLSLDVKWRRKEPTTADINDLPTAFTLEIPRFVVPMGEPRVLATSTQSKSLPGLLHMDYMLENPSMHFLTFNLTMEASEQFAFSGPKSTTIQLVPLSRLSIRYNLLSLQQGVWIQPQLVVVDTFFNKTLRVLPTEDIRATKKGIMVWVDVFE